jgi:hypothetical protein
VRRKFMAYCAMAQGTVKAKIPSHVRD